VPEITYPASSASELNAYLALPRGEGPWPGVVVIQDALGLSDDIREQADRLAAAGYVSFAPDLYSGRGVRCVLATLQASRTGRGAAYDDIEAARTWLSEREDCTGRIGLIGFCMGGGFAAMMAPLRYGFDASSVNYGELPKDAVSYLADACPIVGSYGRRDVMLRGRASKLEQALTTNGIAHDVKEYPDAGHSFLNRINAGPVLGTFVKLTAFNYNHAAAEDAWARILTFFDEHVRDAPVPAPASASASA
jgi:carboxymethylenebutenolidase